MSTVIRDAFSITRLSFWIGTLSSTLIGSLLYLATQRSIESDAEERFNNHAKYAQSVISVRVKSYTDVLRGAGSMLESSENMTHAQFHAYMRGLGLSKHYPAIDTVNVAMFVAEKQRPAFMWNLRNEMERFLPPGLELKLSPPGVRPYYLVVGIIEPDAPWADHYGMDLLANPYFGSQLMESRDSGKMHAAGTPIPALSTPNDNHLGLRMPLYKPGAPVDTVEQRRKAYMGSIGLAFSIPKLLQGVMEEIPLSGVRMTLYDTGNRIGVHGRNVSARPLVLFDSHGSPGVPAPPLDQGPDVFSTTLPLDFNGRPWKVVYSAHRSKLYTEFDVNYPKLMMGFGFLGSILLYALLHMLTSSRRAALALAQEMTSELRESQSKLQQSHKKLRQLADHAHLIKELERKRIAREIHDDLGQNLLALRIEAELLAARTKERHGFLHKRVAATLQHIDTTIKSVRQIINDLRPTVLDLGLSAAVEWQVDQFQRRTGIACELHDDHGEIALPDQCATEFFRILQESLTNIVRHADASKVVVELRLDGSWLYMTVQDNGCGLPPGGHNKFGSFGLVGIEERIMILGGTCSVSSGAGKGTTVTVAAPVGNGADRFSRPMTEAIPESPVI
jgi:signal transduction histidine kinase